MAGGFLLVAFGGFIPTYWAKVATGTFHAEPIIHIHGGFALLAQQLLTAPIAATAAWMHIAKAFAALAS